jgi:hypothetical protein
LDLEGFQMICEILFGFDTFYLFSNDSKVSTQSSLRIFIGQYGKIQQYNMKNTTIQYRQEKYNNQQYMGQYILSHMNNGLGEYGVLNEHRLVGSLQ